MDQVVQAVQANNHCPRVNLFREWKNRIQQHNKETPVPPVPPVESALPHTGSGVSAEHSTDALVPPPSDWHSFTLSDVPTDPLHTGRLEGRVPHGWTRNGWIAATRDRIVRTDDPVVRRMLQGELDAVEAPPPPVPGEHR